jgi:signal transduction histidine kinase
MGGNEPVNILLVDDQPAKLLTYEAILRGLGETLIMAGSGREALEHLLKKDIAVVLIDVIMPDLDGFELAAMIRNHPRFQTTAMIFVSAIAMTDLDRLKGYEYGAVDYVPVPVVPELLRAKVKVFAELYRKTRQLELLNVELESRVEQRTAELAQANAELERRVEERTREREMALAQVHEMQKMESLGQLTGGVAHDFNNVLMAVLGNLDLIGQNTADPLMVKRLADGAIQAAERGATLTRRMLAFARRQELRPEAVDVVRHINSMVDMLRRSIGPSIEIRVEFEEMLSLIRVDPNQLELAILNLALNARDAMPQGGRLTIAADRQSVAANDIANLDAGDYVRLSVGDTGLGMDEATLKRAPEPFFTTKGVGKGTGLGLSMVYGLAAQSGGGARLSSHPGNGTTIELWFPVASTSEARPPRAAPVASAEAAAPCSVLFVDDDPMVSSSTVAMLEQLGHRVLAAPSGALALDVLRLEPKIDLVITDHAMPGMDGMELAERIRDMKPSLPIILATGYADVPASRDATITRIDKPYRLERLKALIAAVMGERRGSAPAAPALGRAMLG